MKILVGYDDSKTAHDALALARKHARAFDAHVVVVRSMSSAGSKDLQKVQEAEKLLAYAKEMLEQKGVSGETHLLVRGLSPGEDIVRFAEEKKVDEIFIGVKRRSNLSKIVFGSNARYIIIEAPCPVMTVK